jgi:hypothetical protein
MFSNEPVYLASRASDKKKPLPPDLLQPARLIGTTGEDFSNRFDSFFALRMKDKF